MIGAPPWPQPVAMAAMPAAAGNLKASLSSLRLRRCCSKRLVSRWSLHGFMGISSLRLKGRSQRCHTS